MRLHQLDPCRFDDLLEELELDRSLLERDPNNISGGELQRFTVLRALLLDPVFLFADEPTSRLDPLPQKKVMALICRTMEKIQCGLLLVSHDLELLAKTCDRVVRIGQ